MQILCVILLACLGLSQCVRLEFYEKPNYQGKFHIVRYALPYVCDDLPAWMRESVSSVKFESFLGGASVSVFSDLNCKGLSYTTGKSVPNLGNVGFKETVQSYKVSLVF